MKLQVKPAHNSLSIWFIHDQRPGHLNQLKGLAARLKAHSKTQNTNFLETWIDATKVSFSWKEVLLKTPKNSHKPQPDIVISAGHSTHKLLLQTARIYHAFSVVLMKPSLPFILFDAIICPQHDQIKRNKRVFKSHIFEHALFESKGALNNITPPALTVKKTKFLMLIGGPSKHFLWDENRLIDEIKAICQHDRDKTWLLSDSPRTPISLLPKLRKLKLPNLHCHHFKDASNGFDDLPALLQQSATTWISPDSMSMLYEALTANSPSFVFSMTEKRPLKPGRIVESVNHLIQEKVIYNYLYWQSNPNKIPQSFPLWEADRAALWLLEYFNNINTANKTPQT